MEAAWSRQLHFECQEGPSFPRRSSRLLRPHRLQPIPQNQESIQVEDNSVSQPFGRPRPEQGILSLKVLASADALCSTSV